MTNDWQVIGGEMHEIFISLHVTSLCASWAVLPDNLIRKAGLQVYAQLGCNGSWVCDAGLLQWRLCVVSEPYTSIVLLLPLQ